MSPVYTGGTTHASRDDDSEPEMRNQFGQVGAKAGESEKGHTQRTTGWASEGVLLELSMSMST